MNALSLRSVLGPASLVMVSLGVLLAACSDDDDAGEAQPGAGSGGAAGGAQAGSAGQPGGGKSGGAQAGTGGLAGVGGAAAGASGSSGQAGTGGSAAGAGGGAGKVVPLFVGQGHLGRTTVSCDDGLTWIADQSENDSQKCWSDDNYDCDHKSNSGTGLTFGGGYFYVSTGWGEAGPMRRSTDGFHWEKVLDKTTFSGLAFADGVLLAGGQSVLWSTDGTTWSEPVSTPLPGHARQLAAGTLNGVPAFAMAGDGPSATVSTDGGKTWVKPDGFPTFAEGEYWANLAVGGNAVVAMTSKGRVIRTVDGGKSWAVAAEIQEFPNTLIWTGTEFVTWLGGKFLHSADGATWKTETSDLPFSTGPAERGPTGTFVMVNGGWQTWYEKQQFARSTDGMHWTVLPDGAYKKSHPMRRIVAGEGVCPTGN